MTKQPQFVVKQLIYNLVSPVAKRILRSELASFKQTLARRKAQNEELENSARDKEERYSNELARLNESLRAVSDELRISRAKEQEAVRKLGYLYNVFPPDEHTEPVPDEYRSVHLGYRALMKLISDYEFETVLDIGSGAGEQAAIFLKYGKKVTALDYGKSPYYERRDPAIQTVIGDFNTYEFAEPFDCIWASHVLEHQVNPNIFLRKVHHVTKEGGIVAISVPPLKHQVVGGHVALWNAGLLLYHLVLAGFDCREASVLRYGYNISVIVIKKTFELPEDMAFDQGDIRRIKQALPSNLEFAPNAVDDPFNGDILRLNW